MPKLTIFKLANLFNFIAKKQMDAKDSGEKQHPVFMKEYEILKSLGEGNTSKVYMARSIKDKKIVALKIFREEFLTRDSDSIRSVEKEIEIL